MEKCEHDTNVRHSFEGRLLCDPCYAEASAPQREARARTIDQVAQLFPYLSIAERTDWWKRLGCSITELTTYMHDVPNPQRDDPTSRQGDA